MIRNLPENLQGVRDRALLLIGFAGGFRRSELAALAVENVAVEKDGLVVTLRRSKTDQEGQGRKVALPYGSNPETCPVRAYRDWLEVGRIAAGAVFREVDRQGYVHTNGLHKDSIGLIIKRAISRIALDPTEYAGHSLRAGLATQAYVQRRQRAVHHATDRTPLAGHRPQIHPRRLAVPG